MGATTTTQQQRIYGQWAARSKSPSNARLVCEWHTGCSGAACESHIAAFLVGAGEDAYWGQGGWPGWVLPGRRRAGAANRWMPQYFEKPLGAPLADGRDLRPTDAGVVSELCKRSARVV
jgi:hypothetical protein